MTFIVKGFVFPTLVTFFQQRLKITSSATLWAVIIGGVSAISAKLNEGGALKFVPTGHGQEFFQMVLGTHYLSILPILLCLVAMAGVSRITRP